MLKISSKISADSQTFLYRWTENKIHDFARSKDNILEGKVEAKRGGGWRRTENSRFWRSPTKYNKIVKEEGGVCHCDSYKMFKEDDSKERRRFT